MGAPAKFTSDQIALALRETKGMVTVAARKLGCSHNTIYKYAEKHQNVKDALREERQLMGDIAELALFKAIQNGEMSAIIFYLKTQCKDRGYIERHEHTGADGAPIQQTFTLRIDRGDEYTLPAG